VTAGLPCGVKRLADAWKMISVGSPAVCRCGGGARSEMRDVVDLVGVQADGLDQVDLDLIAGDNAPDQFGAGFPVCWATARIGGCCRRGEYSAARNVS